MPNWVINKVAFGTDKVLKECISEYKDGGGKYFDFNKIIPMPKELDATVAPNLDADQVAEYTKKYGAGDWYSWRIKNWDTKWLPSETEVIDDYNVEFETPWSTPCNIFKEISRKYKTSVLVEYADEDLGENCGTLKYDRGKLMEHTIGDYNFACELWGIDPEEK